MNTPTIKFDHGEEQKQVRAPLQVFEQGRRNTIEGRHTAGFINCLQN